MIGGGNQATAAAQYGAPANAPKEIGLLQRIEGVRGGLDEIHGRLRAFSERLSGSGAKDSGTEPVPHGLPGNVAASEDRIRSILVLLGSLESAF